MGVLKNRTEDTMTTTRLTQLATEWVTGDTLARIIYEICHLTGDRGHCQLSVAEHKIFLQIVCLAHLLVAMEAEASESRPDAEFLEVQALHCECNLGKSAILLFIFELKC
jgi:hypothetical protein